MHCIRSEFPWWRMCLHWICKGCLQFNWNCIQHFNKDRIKGRLHWSNSINGIATFNQADLPWLRMKQERAQCVRDELRLLLSSLSNPPTQHHRSSYRWNDATNLLLSLSLLSSLSSSSLALALRPPPPSSSSPPPPTTTTTKTTTTLKHSSLLRFGDRSASLFLNVNANFADFVRFQCFIDLRRALRILNKVLNNNIVDARNFQPTAPIDLTPSFACRIGDICRHFSNFLSFYQQRRANARENIPVEISVSDRRGTPSSPPPPPPRPSLSFWILNANSLSIFRLLPIRLNWSILAGRDAASIENLINLLDKRLIINNIRKDTGTSTIKYRQIMSSSDKSQHCLFFFSPSVCLCFNVIQNGE